MGKTEAEFKKKGRHVRIRKRFVRILAFIFITALTVISCYSSYNYVMDRSKGKDAKKPVNVDPEKGVYIEIPRGAGTETIARILKEKGIIKYPYLFKILSMVNGYDGAYQSGTHLVSKDLKYEEIMRILASKPVSVKVTIPEGYTLKQIASALQKNKLVDNTEEFFNIANSNKFDFAFLKDLPMRENRLEGYLFPDTYEFDINASEEEIISAMLKNFDVKFKPEYYKRAEQLDMTVDQIIILASIIEREAQLPEERERIAGVFYNRLRSKDRTMRRLESCATIQYIYFMKEGVIKQKITEEDTKISSPYNTYIIEGLPPGPICCPGEDSIKAALFPEETEYMFFVSKGDGSHHFSKTFKEHQTAIKKYGSS